MARWLSSLALGCGLWVVGTCSDFFVQNSGRSRAQEGSPRSEVTHRARSSGHVADTCDDGVRDGKHGDGREKVEGKGGGRFGGRDHEGQAAWRSAFAWRRVFESVRREGSPIELLPLLGVPEVLEEIDVDSTGFKPKLDAYMAAMQKRVEDDRKSPPPTEEAEIEKLFSERMDRENKFFAELFEQLKPAQRDRLIGLFIQARGYRSVSNQAVSAKLGLKDAEALDLRRAVETIREETMHQSRDRFRHIFDKGGDRSEFEKLVHENQKQMDARIEKKLSDQQREKLAELRGKPFAGPQEWLARGVEMPRPPGGPRGEPRPAPPPAQRP